jgi:dedicator of cytokinesis protein 1
LGARDLVREKVYLVCYVVKLGGMEKSNNGPKTLTSTESIVRRPYGVAAMDITLYINGKLEPDEDKHHFLPLIQSV